VTNPTTTVESAKVRPPAPPADQRGALVRLVLIVAAGLLTALFAGVLETVIVVLAIVAMIMLHELGHFVTAKWSGMKVTEYFLGFGPRLWSIRRGETEYGVKAVPLGGYVKIIGMSNLEIIDPADESRTYRQKSYPRRLSVAVAGSVVHFMLAFTLLWGLHTFVGIPRPLLTIGNVATLKSGPSPAQQAGLRPGDRIVSVDGRPLKRWEDLTPYIVKHPGRTIELSVRRAGQTLAVPVTPVDINTQPAAPDVPTPPAGKPYGFVGIGPKSVVEKANPVMALGRAGVDLGRDTKMTVSALGDILSLHGFQSYFDQVSGKVGPSVDAPRFLSPVGFVKVASVAAHSGVRTVLILLIMINVFVGMFNMIPVPPFDGGHVAVATYERIRSRRGRPHRADMAKLMPVAYAMVGVLLVIFVTSLYLDIFHFPAVR